MAAFQFTFQQIILPPENLDNSSPIDSLSSVVDPNVDFISENAYRNGKSDSYNFQVEWKDVKQQPSKSFSKVTNSNEFKNSDSPSSITETSYPTIPLSVAEYINKNNPTLLEEAEAHLMSENFKMSATNIVSEKSNPSHFSPLHSLSITSGALALQQSVIGNFGVKPVSADIVAQVVANTKRLERESCSQVPSEKTHFLKTELVRYPAESISSTVEKYSWFSNSSVDFCKSLSMDIKGNTLAKDHSNNQSCIDISTKMTHSSLPEVHSKALNSSSNVYENSYKDINSPYEIYPDSSFECETESSISEKFETESLYSEAFEAESNFSEVNGIDDEKIQVKKIKNSSDPDDNVINYGTQADIALSHANTSPLKPFSKVVLISDKAIETDDCYHFDLLREKANLEGQLESVSKDQVSLVKERDNFRSMANSYEAQVKSLQKQLDIVLLEKKNAVHLLESQKKEQNNWDNVIKEYQNIVEAKNEEIKSLKEDLSEYERTNTCLKVNHEELKVEIESKEGAIAGLKKKIAELHVEVHVLLQGKIQLENEVKNVRLEMETLQKSKEWFQNQLHSTQNNRNKLYQELITLQNNETSTNNTLEKLMMEKNELYQELMHTRQCAVSEKEMLMKHLETIEADMRERELLFDEIQKDKGTSETLLADRIRKLEEEKLHFINLNLTLQDQEYQIDILKSECQEKMKLIESLNNEKIKFSKQIAMLQKSYNDKDILNQQLHQEIKDLNKKISHLENALSRSEDIINTFKEEKTATDIALASTNEEKRVVNEALKSVSENLSKFKHSFKIMKAELLTKTSQTDQLIKEKQHLEDTLRKNEENLSILQKNFHLQVKSESQNHCVLLDDLQKEKNNLENVLNVYRKDLLNYQQIVKNLTNEKDNLVNDNIQLKSVIENEKLKTESIREENDLLKSKLCELENQSSKILDDNVQISNNKNLQILHQTKRALYKKLKEKIKECDYLKQELSLKNTTIMENNFCKATNYQTGSCKQETLHDLQKRLEELQNIKDEKTLLLKKNEEIIIELERERGKAIGLVDKYENLKKHLSELEASLESKDSEIVQLQSELKVLNFNLAEHSDAFKSQILSLESDVKKEKALVKNLRQQIFQEKRLNSHLQRDISSLKSALEQANKITDSKKQEIESLQNEFNIKVQAELNHRAQVEHFQTEIHLQQINIEKLTNELEEVKARDPVLAEQIKVISWKLKEKTNEVIALKEKLNLMEERTKLETDNLKKNLQVCRSEMDAIKMELKNTRQEKFNYQNKVMELRKALKSKLGELRSKGILHIDENGSVIHLNVPDPEISFDETYVNSLLQKSMNLSENRPLNNLQECLNSLKEEMMLLQKKIVENKESS